MLGLGTNKINSGNIWAAFLDALPGAAGVDARWCSRCWGHVDRGSGAVFIPWSYQMSQRDILCTRYKIKLHQVQLITKKGRSYLSPTLKNPRAMATALSLVPALVLWKLDTTVKLRTGTRKSATISARALTLTFRSLVNVSRVHNSPNLTQIHRNFFEF